MKIAVSNIAWEPSELDEHLSLLKGLGCRGVEIAPSIIWEEPVLSTKQERSEFLGKVNKRGLTIAAMHALTYNHPEFSMFDTREAREAMKGYLFRLIKLAGDLKCPVMVFGSPQSRKVGKGDYEKCMDIAVGFFRELGEEAERNRVNFCIEPLGPLDNCDFIRNSDEACELIQKVGSRGFGLHLDARAMINNKEDYERVFSRCGSILKHLHVSDPGLRPPGTVSKEHVRIGRALKKSRYKNYISIEMRRGFGPSKEVIIQSVKYIKKCYGR